MRSDRTQDSPRTNISHLANGILALDIRRPQHLGTRFTNCQAAAIIHSPTSSLDCNVAPQPLYRGSSMANSTSYCVSSILRMT